MRVTIWEGEIKEIIREHITTTIGVSMSPVDEDADINIDGGGQ